MKSRVTGSLAAGLSLVGACVGLGIALLSAWGDYEGLSYFATGASYDRFGGLDCPVMLSSRETGKVSATFDNEGLRPIQPYFEVEVSGPVASRNLEGHVAVPPGGSSKVSWNIDSQDVALGAFIFVRLEVLPLPGFRTRQATCGVLSLPLAGLSGEEALNVGLVGFAFLTLAGCVLAESTAAKNYDRPSSFLSQTVGGPLLRTLGVTACLALLAGIAAWWLAAVVLSAVGLLLLVITARYLLF